MPLNVCVPSRLAHVQDESATAPSDNVWHEIKSMAFTPVFLPGESHGQGSLVGYIQSIGSQRYPTCCEQNI